MKILKHPSIRTIITILLMVGVCGVYPAALIARQEICPSGDCSQATRRLVNNLLGITIVLSFVGGGILYYQKRFVIERLFGGDRNPYLFWMCVSFLWAGVCLLASILGPDIDDCAGKACTTGVGYVVTSSLIGFSLYGMIISYVPMLHRTEIEIQINETRQNTRRKPVQPSDLTGDIEREGRR